MVIQQHSGGSIHRFWPKNQTYELYDPNEAGNNIVETEVHGEKLCHFVQLFWIE